LLFLLATHHDRVVCLEEALAAGVPPRTHSCRQDASHGKPPRHA
jgi:hypothetical protein